MCAQRAHAQEVGVAAARRVLHGEAIGGEVEMEAPGRRAVEPQLQLQVAEADRVAVRGEGGDERARQPAERGGKAQRTG